MLNTSTRDGAASGTIAERLLARETELRALLRGSVPAAVREVQAGHAAHELDQVLAAVRRLQDGCYGECTSCGGAIDPRRLQALPAAPYCTACQQARELAGVSTAAVRLG